MISFKKGAEHGKVKKIDFLEILRSDRVIHNINFRHRNLLPKMLPWALFRGLQNHSKNRFLALNFVKIRPFYVFEN
jgi:hypothetical protein